MAKDGRLKLSEKLSLAALEKNKSKEVAVDPQYRHLPKGTNFSLVSQTYRALILPQRVGSGKASFLLYNSGNGIVQALTWFSGRILA